ncbi:hypothetical protein E2493_09075 [Sphingomonas parva]|uniref:Uncharacterized protein n=1 Tax=Sphingomonas parva TaxID=2555898 RepID=A0A4Y8ZVV3_9SPHN|nr:hypothetical protein [Sphingomonas parva]TFI58566.1 hypothetical protein E2493_09075 [Sphingomonas parva]
MDDRSVVEPPAGPVPARIDDPRSYVLDRARSEVHLLLDNLSANPDMTIFALTAANPPRNLGRDWLEQVCRISWPPDPRDSGTARQAEQAALLIKVKDYLNSLAKPASGATIAFTLMVTQDHDATEQAAGGTPAGVQGDDTPSRSSLACEAYPDLLPKARAFRRWMYGMGLALILILAGTCLLSWYVAVGNAALADLSAAERSVAAAQKQVIDARSAIGSGAAQAAGGRGTAAPAPAEPTVLAAEAAADEADGAGYVVHYCSAAARQGFERNAELMEGCIALVGSVAVRDRIRKGLDNWAWFWGDQDTARWMLNMLGSAVLPVLYGFLGAAASIVRSVSRKIKLSLLSPRDLQLSIQQLALGAVVGACIGLFIAGPDDGGGTEMALLGPVALSSSAISFVAGFGVEAVFQALEALISRIFNIAPVAAGQPAIAAAVHPAAVAAAPVPGGASRDLPDDGPAPTPDGGATRPDSRLP